jgi:hypothetical protein
MCVCVGVCVCVSTAMYIFIKPLEDDRSKHVVARVTKLIVILLFLLTLYPVVQTDIRGHYATSRKVAGSSPDEVDFFQFT